MIKNRTIRTMYRWILKDQLTAHIEGNRVFAKWYYKRANYWIDRVEITMTDNDTRLMFLQYGQIRNE